jgi:soluble lytic murein transglycosylase-like protein
LTWQRHGETFQAAARRSGVPVELLLATACTESGGHAEAVREEPGYVSDAATPERVSPGLMQTLISTARDALHDPGLDRARLLDPATSIAVGAALIRRQALRSGQPTGFDPPLVAVAYNAGSLRATGEAENPWGLVQTRRDAAHWHADSFCAFFNDALAVLADSPPEATTPSFSRLLG